MHEFEPHELLALQQTSGRWFIKAIHQQPLLYTTNLGSTLRFTTDQCTQLVVEVTNFHSPLGPSQVWAWRIDAGSWHRVTAANYHFTINCSPEQHLIEIITAGNSDLDQVWTGQAGFGIANITIDDGQLTSAPHQPVIDFIGDSITAGCWVAGKHAALDYRPETNYVGVACDDLSALGVRVAYSAGGVLRPATGGVPNARHYLAQLDAVDQWQPNHPDLVVVNLGVNDRRYPVDQFMVAYDDMLKKVQQLFDNVPTVIMIPFKQSFAHQIKSLAQQHGLAVIDTASWHPTYTDGLHPDQAGSIRCGHQLAQALGPFLKWISVQCKGTRLFVERVL